MNKKAIVTGGSGFIGSCLVKMLVNDYDFEVLNIDNLTYASHPESLKEVESLDSYKFLKTDICNNVVILKAIEDFKPTVIFHLAAESHVDRSIESSDPFIHSNILGTHSMLKASLSYWEENNKPENFRFIHVSTDEVYGSLGFEDPAVDENAPYKPSSPYSASKASSDLLVNAWTNTYGFPAIITHCTNNYGEYQHDEKLIPTIIRTALQGSPIPIYGKGTNIRDWLYVGDHCQALLEVFEKGLVGECYNICGSQPFSNMQMAYKICELLDQFEPRQDKEEYGNQITFVADRLGHDVRYAVNDSKIKKTMGWMPKLPFEERLTQTVKWFLKEYYERNYLSGGERNPSVSSDKVHL